MQPVFRADALILEHRKTYRAVRCINIQIAFTGHTLLNSSKSSNSSLCFFAFFAIFCGYFHFQK
jgi:hypothetical protein